MMTSRSRTRQVILLRATADFLHQDAATQNRPVKVRAAANQVQFTSAPKPIHCFNPQARTLRLHTFQYSAIDEPIRNS